MKLEIKKNIMPMTLWPKLLVMTLFSSNFTFLKTQLNTSFTVFLVSWMFLSKTDLQFYLTVLHTRLSQIHKDFMKFAKSYPIIYKILTNLRFYFQPEQAPGILLSMSPWFWDYRCKDTWQWDFSDNLNSEMF